MKDQILGPRTSFVGPRISYFPRTSFVVPRTPLSGAMRNPLRAALGLAGSARDPVRTLRRASGASEAGALGTTKEVLGFIIAFLNFNWDFLGFPILLLGFPRIS